MAHGHTLSGLLAAVPGQALLLPVGASPAQRGVFVAVCAVGALVPDLDAPGAKLSRALGPVTWALAEFLCWLSKVAFHATRTELDPKSTGGHRTMTHTVVFSVLAGVVVSVLVSLPAGGAWGLVAGAGIAWGCLAHIAGDCCTESGCPVFWPVTLWGRRWRMVGIPKLLRFKTGKWVEKLVITPLLVLACCAAFGWDLGVWQFLDRMTEGLAF